MKRIIILLGVPGSGKGTQAATLAEKLQYAHISTGELFRSLRKKEIRTETENTILSLIDQGKLVPDEHVYDLVFTEIQHGLEKHNGIILDGAIRTTGQAERYLTFFEEHGLTDDVLAIELEMSDDMIRQRLKSRGREDDSDDVIEKRIETQGNAVLEPITEVFAQKGLLTKIDGTHNIEQVHEALESCIRT